MKTILIIMLLGLGNNQDTIHNIEFDSVASCETAKERTINAISKNYNRSYFVYCVEK
ncbi:hypothetical protein [Thorsellia anophelis]|uniref:Uncharacterized protein n=1 Tax=Thorsellia anophelis DSM 18579 TaxID=1123402 RepID=A0A1I0FNZ6_9GAMM|nr:hypothetical protein [Thorsellia anophelis]SET60069.1 hypothetical protein SAMN02583745_02839 [Thorsellia anophelis DSM 18579]